MSVLVDRASTSDGGHSQSTGGGDLPRRRRIILLVVVALFACVAWWETHPNLFPAFGNSAEITNRTSEPALFVLSWPGSHDRGAHTVTILALSPHVRSAPPGTSIRTVSCSRRWAAGALIVDRGSLQAVCLHLRPAVGATFKVAHRSGDQLLLEVSRSQPGTVIIDGATVTYRSGLRLGRQHIGVLATAQFSANAVN